MAAGAPATRGRDEIGREAIQVCERLRGASSKSSSSMQRHHRHGWNHSVVRITDPARPLTCMRAHAQCLYVPTTLYALAGVQRGRPRCPQ